MKPRSRAGIVFWHNAALITFAAVAIGMTWTVMSTGFSSSEVVKETIEGAVDESTNSLQVIGRMTGTAQVEAEEVTITATPLTTLSQKSVDTEKENIRVSYSIIKEGAYTVTQEDVYAGALYGTSYNSIKSALEDAKMQGLIEINPLADSEKPQQTVAFLYWVISLHDDTRIQSGEIANLVMIYSENDRPATGEYLQIQIHDRSAVILDIQRTVPHVTTAVLDFGGKVKDSD